MNYNINRTKISDRPDTLESVRDRGGAQEEPYASVRSAHVRLGNPRTGSGLSGLANPAQVNETPKHVSHEADDTDVLGRGSRESDTDPLGSLLFGGGEAPEDHSMTSESESEEETSGSSSDEEDPPETAGRNTNRIRANVPKKRPGLKIASLNMRGRLKDGKDKMRMTIDWMRTNQISILALQETHILTEEIDELNKTFKHIKFYGTGISTASSGILILVNNNTEAPITTEFKNIVNGRIGSLKLDYGDQDLYIINVYMPNNKTQQKETLADLRSTLKTDKNIKNSELIILGDWNFVEDQIDRSPQHSDDRGVTREMTKLKTSFELTDGWRKANPQTRSFTWEGTNGNDGPYSRG
jgi:exonuclease III